MQSVPLITNPRMLAAGMLGRDRLGQVYVGLGNGQFLTLGTGSAGRSADRSASGAAPPDTAGVLRAEEGQLRGGSTTSHLPEGDRRYFTEERARAAVAEALHDVALVGWMEV